MGILDLVVAILRKMRKGKIFMNINGKSCIRISISVFLLYLCITYWPTFMDLIHSLLQAATPLLLGCVLAYAINILMTFYEMHYFPRSINSALIKSRRPVCNSTFENGIYSNVKLESKFVHSARIDYVG